MRTLGDDPPGLRGKGPGKKARGRERRHPRRWEREPGTWGRGPWGGPNQQQAPAGAAVVMVTLIQLIGSTIAMHAQPAAVPLDGLGYGLLVAGPVTLLARRRWPLVSLATTLSATVGYLALGYPRGPFFLAAVVALFAAVRRANRIVVWAMCGAAYAAYVFVGDGPYVTLAIWTVVALVLAEASRVRGQHFTEVAAARAAAQQARQEQSRRQASDERLRIARELHDVLGHHLSLINVRAGVGLHLLDSDPEQAREALGAIKLASSEALREVRGVLSTLSPQPQAPRSPAPGLAGLPELVEQARTAGLTVTVQEIGIGPVPGDVDRAAYRIVQEALTNVRRHAGPAATASITIERRPDQLSVRVDDTGPGPTDSTSDGNGLPGMRERAAALGGTLTVSRNDGGGFRVQAQLPLTQENS
jgi:signal transduction histidine kinase